jgi:hypothetical protein
MNKKQIHAIVAVFIFAAFVFALTVVSITGYVVKVSKSWSGTEVYTKAEVDTKLSAVNSQLISINTQLTSINSKLDNLESNTQLTSIIERLNVLETQNILEREAKIPVVNVADKQTLECIKAANENANCALDRALNERVLTVDGKQYTCRGDFPSCKAVLKSGSGTTGMSVVEPPKYKCVVKQEGSGSKKGYKTYVYLPDGSIYTTAVDIYYITQEEYSGETESEDFYWGKVIVEFGCASNGLPTSTVDPADAFDIAGNIVNYLPGPTFCKQKTNYVLYKDPDGDEFTIGVMEPAYKIGTKCVRSDYGFPHINLMQEFQ